MPIKLFYTINKIGFIPFLYKLYNRLIIKDQLILSLCDRNGAFEYIKHTYSIPNITQHSVLPKEKIIWTCWLQGEENAPQIVKSAFNSMRKWAGDFQVVIITNDNIKNYIKLPEWVIQKYQAGIIPAAHYSDIIRLSLLLQHGGVWLDSTIYVSDKLPSYLTNTPLFCFKCNPICHEIMGNCILACDKNNPIIDSVLHFLLNYWEKENRLISYSIFHIIWELVVYSSNYLNELWDSIPYVTMRTQCILRQELSNPYTQQRFEEICQMTSLHKLTYKFDEYHIDTTKKGTFYDVLINQNTPSC